MGETLNRRRRLTFSVDGSTLRVYALFSLLCYSIGAGLLERRLPAGDAAGLAQRLAQDPELMALSTWAALLRLAGGLGWPVFAFLLAERFVHSDNYGRDLTRLAALALVSEIPYDLCITGRVWDPAAQSGALTLTVALVMLYGLRLWRGKPGVWCRMAQGAVVFAALLWCNLLRAQSGLYLVISAAIFYLYHDRKGRRLLLSALWTLAYVFGGMLLAGDGGALGYLTGLLSVYVLWCHDGRDDGGKMWLYLAYPVHLLIVFAMGLLI